MKKDVNELLGKLKNIQITARTLVKDLHVTDQINSLKTVLKTDRKKIEKAVDKAKTEVQKLVKMMPNLEEGQAMLQGFLKKNGLNFDSAFDRVGKQAAKKVKVGVRTAKKVVKTKVRQRTSKSS